MKSIPATLLAHEQEEATTLCLLCRVLTKDGVLYGFTNLDASITYDPATVDPHSTGDDWGSAVHAADNGFTPERLQMSADLNVDNTDLQGWVSDAGITEAMIRAGLFDYAKVRVYRVNYMDLTQGHELVGTGTVGETKFSNAGWRAEWRSLKQQLRQTISKVYSLTCRAQFGSKPIGTVGEQPTERYPCGKDWVWTTSTITAVDVDEPARIFTDTANTEADGFYEPGVVEILDGPNAGKQMEIDTQASDVFTLALELPYPLTVGVSYRRRRDCDKTKPMCKDVHDNLVNMRAEYMTPISDGGGNMIPGAQ